MIRQAIPFATSFGTLTAMWLLSQKRWQGWVVGLCNQVLWITMSIVFGTWGLLPLSVALIFIYIRGLITWRREALATTTEEGAIL